MPIEQQVVVVYAATKGFLDKLNVSEIGKFEEKLLKEIEPQILNDIKEKKVISDELNQKLKTFFDNFTQKFLAAR